LAFLFVVTLLIVSFTQVRQGQATSDNREHELGVYSLYQYEGDWKCRVMIWEAPDREIPDYESHPELAFWDLMTGGVSAEYAHHTSRRRVNPQVNYRTIFPIPGDGWKDWDGFDMVFFYGHNNMITPPHPRWEDAKFWSNNSGIWEEITGPYWEWGTETLPFEYYIMDVVDGPTHPSAVTYLYEPYTSALIGHHQFIPDLAWPVQLSAQDTPEGNTPRTFTWCTGGLGSNDLEWLILQGCQAVIVADADGITYNHMGVDAFRETWDGFHLILGHYRLFGAWPNDLSPFADGLRTGMPVQAAYFLIDPDNCVSAISAEGLGSVVNDVRLFNHALQHASYMNTDTWTSPKADLARRPDLWYVKWIRRSGTTASRWTLDEDS